MRACILCFSKSVCVDTGNTILQPLYSSDYFKISLKTVFLIHELFLKPCQTSFTMQMQTWNRSLPRRLTFLVRYLIFGNKNVGSRFHVLFSNMFYK